MSEQSDNTLHEANENQKNSLPEKKSESGAVDHKEQDMLQAGVDVPKGASEEAVSNLEKHVAENAEKQEQDEIPVEDYSQLDFEELIKKFRELLDFHEIRSIHHNVERIRKAFYDKNVIAKKEAEKKFVSEGGELKDFLFKNPYFPEFSQLVTEYKKRRKEFYEQYRVQLETNLSRKKSIIEELKTLIDEGNADTMFEKFKQIQNAWREVGPVPRDQYKDLWRTYHFHVNRFYDLQHLRKDLRNLDFKHNLEEKLKLVERAEELAKSDDVNKAFKELQILHRMWKEEIGPVAREHREEIWQRFSEATRIIHQKKQELSGLLKEEYENNLKLKKAIIQQIAEHIPTEESDEKQSTWKKRMAEVDKLREAFFAVGPIPRKESQEVWNEFKETVREFNRKKNAFFKGLKKQYKENIRKKKELLAIAEELKDSNDFEQTTEIMKKIQQDWKKVGQVPRKISDSLWAQFQEACNHYFKRLHEIEDEKNAEKHAIFQRKKDYLEDLKKEIEDNPDFNPDLDTLKTFIQEWKEMGQVMPKQRYIDVKFNKLLDGLFDKLSKGKKEVELLKFKAKIDPLIEAKDISRINDEIMYIRGRIDNLEKEKQQLQNNVMFITTKDDNNPFIRDINKKIDKLEQDISFWKNKLAYIRNISLD